jgi:hypothetical protein
MTTTSGPIKRSRHQAGCALGRVKRPPGIMDDVVALWVLDLDAASADLLGTAVDGEG